MDVGSEVVGRPGTVGDGVPVMQANDGSAAPCAGLKTMPRSVLPFRFGRLRLGYRWTRYLLWCATHGHASGAADAIGGLVRLAASSVSDAFPARDRVVCNICGWEGRRFYPNVGSGYFELDTTCPRCHCIGRYRALAALLEAGTDFFSARREVIEVAPVRGFQAYCLWRKGRGHYISFDLEKFGMERGDLTAMRYADASCDYFLCFHVLEHIPDDRAAVAEIFRVVRPGGAAVLQVPVDYRLADTVEYGAPNPKETGHVRRYSARGFEGLLASHGFQIRILRVEDLGLPAMKRHGLPREPLYLAVKPPAPRA